LLNFKELVKLKTKMSTSQGGKKLTEDDAFAYLKAVKDVFREKMENYSYFLAIMKDYKDEKLVHMFTCSTFFPSLLFFLA